MTCESKLALLRARHEALRSEMDEIEQTRERAADAADERKKEAHLYDRLPAALRAAERAAQAADELQTEVAAGWAVVEGWAGGGGREG